MAKQKDFAQTQVRIPHELLEELKTSADKNFRSLNSEILYLLQIGMKLAEPLVYQRMRKVRRSECEVL